MKFFHSAGFAELRVAAMAGNRAPMLQSGAMVSEGNFQAASLRCLATTVGQSAVTCHQMDFARVDRHTEALAQLRDTIGDLKSRMERKAGGRSRLALSDLGLQLSYKAS